MATAERPASPLSDTQLLNQELERIRANVFQGTEPVTPEMNTRYGQELIAVIKTSFDRIGPDGERIEALIANFPSCNAGMAEALATTLERRWDEKPTGSDVIRELYALYQCPNGTNVL